MTLNVRYSSILQATLFSVSFLGLSVPQANAAEPVNQVTAGPNLTNDVLVTWRNLELTRQDFEIEMEKLAPEYRDDFRKNIARITKRLEDMLVGRTLASEAAALKLDADPVIQRRLQAVREDVLSGAMVNHLRQTTIVPDMTDAALDYYKLNKEKFFVKERVRVSHILIGTAKRSESEAVDLVKEVRQKLLAGEDVKRLAIHYSEDPSVKQNGGDLGEVNRGKMVTEFENAAFSLTKPGDISDIVKTKFGYHVIFLHEREDGRQKPFSEVKEAIVKTLSSKYRTDAVQSYITNIRQDKTIKLNTQAIDSLQTGAVDPK
jgi:peptidyl-prolyl cis-trans isomerase C